MVWDLLLQAAAWEEQNEEKAALPGMYGGNKNGTTKQTLVQKEERVGKCDLLDKDLVMT